jgi:hypothetical protein
LCHDIGVSGEVMRELVRELDGAAQRLELKQRLAERFSEYSHEERPGALIVKAAVIAERCLNQFVSDLGWTAVAIEDRPKASYADGTSQQVFAPRPVSFDPADMPSEPLSFRQTYFLDWVFGFYQLVRDNAKSENGQTINVEQNAKIGGVLNTLAGVLAE